MIKVGAGNRACLSYWYYDRHGYMKATDVTVPEKYYNITFQRQN